MRRLIQRLGNLAYDRYGGAGHSFRSYAKRALASQRAARRSRPARARGARDVLYGCYPRPPCRSTLHAWLHACVCMSVCLYAYAFACVCVRVPPPPTDSLQKSGLVWFNVVLLHVDLFGFLSPKMVTHTNESVTSFFVGSAMMQRESWPQRQLLISDSMAR